MKIGFWIFYMIKVKINNQLNKYQKCFKLCKVDLEKYKNKLNKLKIKILRKMN